MDKTEEQQFKEMLNELRQKHKQTDYELELLNRNRILESKLEVLKNENISLRQEVLKYLEETIELKHNFETFAKKEAIYLMQMIKEECKDREITDNMQIFINRFIFELTHYTFVRKTNRGNNE